MDGEIQQLRARLAQMERGRGKRYSAALRERVAAAATELRRRGQGWQTIGEVLGIPHETVRRFTLASASPAFVPVEVAVPTDGAGGVLVLVSPDGYRVEGLAVADAAEILKRLR